MSHLERIFSICEMGRIPNAYFHRGGGHIWDHKHPLTIGVFNKIPGYGASSKALQQQAAGAKQRQEKALKLLQDRFFTVGGWVGQQSAVNVVWFVGKIYKPRDPRLF